MNCVEQTLRGSLDLPPAQRGDCLSACIASVLELPLADVPHFAAMYDPDVPPGEDFTWWNALQHFGLERGLEVWWLDEDIVLDYVPAGFWIGSVPSLNLPTGEDGIPPKHCVVMKGVDVVWDPNVAPSKRYESIAPEVLLGGYVFVPVDPARAMVTR